MKRTLEEVLRLDKQSNHNHYKPFTVQRSGFDLHGGSHDTVEEALAWINSKHDTWGFEIVSTTITPELPPREINYGSPEPDSTMQTIASGVGGFLSLFGIEL